MSYTADPTTHAKLDKIIELLERLIASLAPKPVPPSISKLEQRKK